MHIITHTPSSPDYYYAPLVRESFGALDRLLGILEHLLYDAFADGQDRLHREIAQGLDEMEAILEALPLTHSLPRIFTGLPTWLSGRGMPRLLRVVSDEEETVQVLCACIDRCKFLLEKAGGYSVIRSVRERFSEVGGGIRFAEAVLTGPDLARFLPRPRLSFPGIPADYR